MKKQPSITELIRTEFSCHADAERALPMKQYMRNQFDFYGISAPQRRAISSAFIKAHPVKDAEELHQIIEQLWRAPQRECQYFAIELLSKKGKLLTADDAAFLEKLITEKSWWDTVDYLAGHVIGPWFKMYPGLIKSITGRWNKSENIWLQRMSLLFQLKYKKDSDITLLIKYIHHLSSSKEFFIQKAIGWILREYSKTDAEWVMDFVKNNKLAPLSKREALKRATHFDTF